jgi:hypothetical protein
LLPKKNTDDLVQQGIAATGMYNVIGYGRQIFLENKNFCVFRKLN